MEIMVTIGIIGMLATLAVPAITEATRNAKVMRAASDMRHFSNALDTYNLANGDYPADTLPGEMPPNMEGIMPFQFVEATPIGGEWDWDNKQFGTNAALSIYNNRLTLETIYAWTRLDKTLDDGLLGSGKIRLRPSGLMLVMEES